MGPEAKLYKKLKQKYPFELSGIGLKTLALLGMPDVLGYNTFGTLFHCRIKDNSS